MRSSRGRSATKVLGVIGVFALGMATFAVGVVVPSATSGADDLGFAMIHYSLPRSGAVVNYGDPFTFKGQVIDLSESCIQFRDCDTPIGTVIIGLSSSFGGATLNLPVHGEFASFSESIPGPSFATFLPANTYTYQSVFDGNFNSGSGFGGSFEIRPRPCETTLTQSVHRTREGDPVTFTARVSTSSAPATGTVQFFQGAPADNLPLTAALAVPASNVVSSGEITVLPSGPTTVLTTVTAVFTPSNNNHAGPCQAEVVHDVAPGPPPPTAHDDLLTTPRDVPITFDPLANDASLVGSLVVFELTGPGPGDLDQDGDEYVYTPPAGFVGEAIFHYTVVDRDGGISPPATIVIDVTCDPVAVDDQYDTAQDTPLTIGLADSVLLNDDTCDEAVSLLEQPENGTVTGFDPTNGLFTYTPDPGFFGVDVFVYAYTSGLLIDDAALVTVRVAAPDAPLPSLVSIGDAERIRPETGTAPMTFTVTRTDPEGAAGEAVTVQYATREDTAIAGVDFTASSGTVTIPSGSTSATFTVPILGNRAGDPDKAFFVDLSAPVGAVIDDGTAVGTIRANGVLAGCSPTDTATGRYVCQVYQDVLGRVPEPGGKAYWAGRVDGGDPREPLMLSFVRQPESRRTAVERLHQLYLGRPGDPATVEIWATQLAAGASLDAVRADILASDELYQRGGTDEAWVEAVYQAVLRRGAEPTGAAFWLDQLRSRSRLGVAKAMLATAEGRSRVVIETYQRFLDRSPSATELADGRAVLATRGELPLQALLLASEEYRANSTA